MLKNILNVLLHADRAEIKPYLYRTVSQTACKNVSCPLHLSLWSLMKEKRFVELLLYSLVHCLGCNEMNMWCLLM